MPGSFAGRAATAVSIAIVLAAAAIVVWRTADIFVLVFAGVLFAVFLRSISDFVRDRTKLSDRGALFTVVAGLAALLGVAIWLMAGDIGEQVQVLGERLPQALEDVRAAYPGMDRVLPSVEQLAPLASRVFTSTLGAGASALVILAIGLYLSVDPAKYKAGIVALFPKPRRRRVAGTLDAVAGTLRLWLMGKVTGMTFVGITTIVGLWALGHPLAFSLGLMAGLLDFIPNIGPLLAFVPAILVSLMDSPTQALYVAILYAVVQTVESYIIEPWLYQRNVDLPPALTISGQVFFSILLGFLGLLVATPLLAVALALVKQLYVEDVLEDQPAASREVPPKAA